MLSHMLIQDYFNENGGNEAEFLRKYREQILRGQNRDATMFYRLLEKIESITPEQLIEFLLICFTESDDPESDEKEKIFKQLLIYVIDLFKDLDVSYMKLFLDFKDMESKYYECEPKLAECNRIVRNRKVMNEAAAMRALPAMPQMQDPHSGKYIQSFFGMPEFKEVPDLQDIKGGKKRRKRRSLRRSLRR